MRQGLRPFVGGALMSWLAILAGIAAGVLLVYLIAALLFPEDLS
jgi:phage shock protein PspC (stress-responsive transcriptional regulator)